MQYAWLTRTQCSGVLANAHTSAGRFNANKLHIGNINIGIKNTHSIRATTHARYDVVGLPSDHLRHLGFAFLTDHSLKISNHHRIRMWACNSTN